ncbi:MAG: adenylyltransferase/cytidyltransferase family protein [Chloroflexi bacterium]|nr:adenylyltransferase/cytidyltransferase family protein [Chloroflexota bacterium]
MRNAAVKYHNAASPSILESTAAARLAADWRERGETVVFTNGHFDLLHIGHVRYLQAARELGDRLIVGLNSDASTRLRKGPGRPIIPQEERAEMLLALRSVDAVVVFEGEDCRELVAAIRPDVYVKGADWNRPDGPRPPEAEVVESYGGRVAYVALVPARSTSDIIEAIRRGQAIS